jgi:hypothetical protein
MARGVQLYEEMRASQTAIQNAERKEADATASLLRVESLHTEAAEARRALASLQIKVDEKDVHILQLNNDAEGASRSREGAPSWGTHTHAHTLMSQQGSHRQCRRNDATSSAHADMTTLPKVDTKCTAPVSDNNS